jgi:hypothetical protein
MNKRLTRRGDRLFLEIDPQMLRTLGIDENSLLSVTADGNSLRVTPADGRSSVDDPTFRAAHGKVMEEYHDVFKKLAE